MFETVAPWRYTNAPWALKDVLGARRRLRTLCLAQPGTVDNDWTGPHRALTIELTGRRLITACFAAPKNGTKRLILAQSLTIWTGASCFVAVFEQPSDFFSTLLGEPQRESWHERVRFWPF